MCLSICVKYTYGWRSIIEEKSLVIGSYKSAINIIIVVYVSVVLVETS